MISTAIATPLPPPRQRVAMPRFSPRRLSAWINVVSTRAPLAPMGWPRATAPPCTLTRDGSRPSSRVTATACTANASFSSTRSTSSSFQPVFVSDVARAVATAVLDPETAGKTYELGGPGVFTMREILELVLTETDNPGGLEWLTGELGMPSHLPGVLTELARLRRMDEAELRRAIVGNFARLIDGDPHMVGVRARLSLV